MSRNAKQINTERHLRQILNMTGEKGERTYVEMGDNLTLGDKNMAIKIFCVDISSIPSAMQFVILCSTTVFFYLIYGYLQELLFHLKEFREHGWYLTLMQFGYYTVFGLIEMLVTGDRNRRIPLQTYVLLAFLTVATMGLSNTSVGYLNYPTQVIFKCCKLIPVMIGGVLIQGKRYSPLDVTAVLMMVLGLILFLLADNSISPTFNAYGVVLILLALCADGVIGNFQEKVLKQFTAGNSEMVFYSYSLGFVYILFGMLAVGDIFSAFKVCKEYPMETYGYGFVFSITGYIGLYIVLTLVKSFGALVAVTVTTCRKAVTIILSFMFFTKPFTYKYVWSGMIVLLGIYLNVYSKNKASWDVTILCWYNKLRHIFGIERQYPIKSVASTV